MWKCFYNIVSHVCVNKSVDFEFKQVSCIKQVGQISPLQTRLLTSKKRKQPMSWLGIVMLVI